MAKPLSPDLRLRIIRAVEVEGMSCRGAAGRFGVAPSTAIELVSEWRTTGACEAAGRHAIGAATSMTSTTSTAAVTARPDIRDPRSTRRCIALL